MTITSEDLIEDRKIITVIKLSSLKFIWNRTIDSKCELKSLTRKTDWTERKIVLKRVASHCINKENEKEIEVQSIVHLTESKRA